MFQNRLEYYRALIHIINSNLFSKPFRGGGGVELDLTKAHNPNERLNPTKTQKLSYIEGSPKRVQMLTLSCRKGRQKYISTTYNHQGLKGRSV